jgi:nucleoside-diphosphate-sugar epimerase/2-polyprenyl-3-methyl-5-hydroxy-6-metoxy-1,4-benzoquinol methylase
MSRVLIIGCEGYIGSYLMKNLNQPFIISGIDKSSTDASKKLHSKFLDSNLSDKDVIIYLGGYNGHAQCNDKTEEDVYNENVADIHLLAKKLTPTQTLIYASTAGVLEGSGCTPVDENFIVNEQLLSKYTRAMYLREKVLLNDEAVVCKTIGLRFGTVIGISDNQRTDLVHIAMVKSAMLQGKIEVYNPDCSRSILHLRELCNCINAIIEYERLDCIPQKSVYNVSSHNSCIAKIANDIASKTGAITIFNSSSDSMVKNKIESFILPDKPVGFSANTEFFTKTFNYTFKSSPTDILDELLEHSERLCCSNLEYTIDQNCRVCSSDKMVTLLDLGEQPLANNYCSEPCEQKKFPLCLIRCKNCSHTQLNYTVPPEEMFSNYQYNSGVSNTLREYFKFIEEKCSKECNSRSESSGYRTRCVLELACNDGTQLDIFKEKGWKTIGIDPATNIIETARNKGHEVYNMFWGTDDIPSSLINRYIDVIVAQNVVAHVPNPVLFLQKCNEIMNEDTVLFVQTSQCDMYINGEFDTVYHEHLSYFTLLSMMKAAELSGLKLIDVEKTPIHGGSFLFTLMKNTCTQQVRESVINMLKSDDEKQIYSDFFYVKYQSKVKTITSWLYKKIKSLKTCGYDIVVYGAAAKGMTLLNCLNIDARDIKYIVDDATMKHGKYSPNNIQIFSPDELKNINTKTAILILAWNFSTEIIKKIHSFMSDTNAGDTLIVVPFPEQKILNLKGTVVDENLIIQPSLSHPNRSKVALISHFYNEEFLLKWWIRQHAPLFDEAILIDYASTDRSLEIIKREAPESWKVVKSRNDMFDAEKVDREVMDIENSLPRDRWKVCLNTTEFLCAPHFRKNLSATNVVDVYQLQNHMMTGDDSVVLDSDKNLIEQRCVYGPNVMFSKSYNRYIHRNHSDIYTVGRHGIKVNAALAVAAFDEGFLCKFIHTPDVPENLARRTQIKTKIPERDVIRNFGENHLWSMQKQIEATNEAKRSIPQLYLNDVHDSIYTKYFSNNFQNSIIKY